MGYWCDTAEHWCVKYIKPDMDIFFFNLNFKNHILTRTNVKTTTVNYSMYIIYGVIRDILKK
jgi:hypothetical protein